MLRVFVADESEAVRQIAVHILSDMGFDAISCSNTLDVLARADAQLPDAVIVDSAMTGALDLIRNIRAMPNGKRTQIFYSLIKADLRCLMAGKGAGASDFLMKPFDRKVLGAAFAHLAATAAA